MIAGYGISTAVRPFLALATSWPHVLALRLADRVGKGMRTAPRDALLASWSEPATRGYVFGLHRSMDHVGAMVGPLLASLFLWLFPEQYPALFALTIVPGTIAVLMLVPVPDAPWPRPRLPRLLTDAAALPLWVRGSTATSASCCCSAWATRPTRTCCCGSAMSASARCGFPSSGRRCTS